MAPCEWAAIVAASVFASGCFGYWEARKLNRATRELLAKIQYDIQRGLEHGNY